MGKFTELLKEERDIENDELYDVNLSQENDGFGFTEINAEILQVLRQIQEGTADIQDLLTYDKEELVGFMALSLDYGLFNRLFKN
jgi:hypothetical protein